jgi:YegS/Rv2252/BmrU family lipid kinase
MTNGVCLIVNPSAGGGRAGRIAATVEDRLRARGLELRSVVATGIEHAREAGVEAANRGETVALLGGDGLIGAVADVVRVVADATIAVLPCGSGNDLARVLAIPRDPLAACEVIASGERVPLDLGEVCPAGEDHGRAFVGIASFGFDSDANRYANEAPRRLGSLVYAYGALRTLARWRAARFELEVDGGERIVFSGYSVAAANSSAYGGGMYAAPSARLDDGQLDLVYCEDVSRLRFLTVIMPKAFKGAHVHERCVHELRGRELSFSADRDFAVYADGDPVGQLPARVRALPAAINVLVPASTAAGWRR